MNRSTFLERSDTDSARRFNALADPARLAILERLGADVRCVCELKDELGLAPNLLSYHLRILREAGLVAGRRLGRRIEYRVVARGLEDLRRDVERLTPEV
jgi:ArsR family transcriptional regulator, arsenate/arsenite/antimonite-responsive transcriptional repressor